MSFALRHPISILVVLVALVATGSVFVFARPEYHPRYESKMIDFSKQDYYSPATVRRTFAAHGIKLYAGDRVIGGIVLLSNRPKPFPADALQVMIASHNGKGSWGPKLEPYDERFGNVAVTYGGKDERQLERVRAAVAALR